MTDSFRALCVELLDKYDFEWRAHERIKSALAQPAPPAEGDEGRQPSGYAYRYQSLGSSVIRFNGGGEVNGSRPVEAIPYWLGRPPQPVPPAEGEVGELVAWLRYHSSLPQTRRAADLLEQRQPAPVPVSERPWAREGWCDEAGRCWLGAPQDGAADAGWILRKPSERLSHQTVSLPANALPLPAGEVE